MKAQVATEYIILLGIVLLAVIPIIYYATSESNRSTRINAATDAVNIVARKAESIYALGQGSRDYVWINIPSGVNDSLVSNYTIRLTFENLGDVAAFPRVNVTGWLPTEQGTYRISVEMLEDVVVIGPTDDTIPPQVVGKAPNGIVRIRNPVLSATTNEPATCKYSETDQPYDNMPNTMDGAGLKHTKQLDGLSNGNYLYYVRCLDRFGNVMDSSAIIQFEVILDEDVPIVTNTAVDKNKVGLGGFVCVSNRVTDNGEIDEVWAFLSLPLKYPLQNQYNYSMTDTGPDCAGLVGDNIYGVRIEMQVPGLWFVNTSFANDTAGNTAYQQPYPNLRINVSEEPDNETIQNESNEGQGGVFEYLPISLGKYFKTPQGDVNVFNKPDSQLSLNDQTLGLTDEDIQTPPAAYNFKYQLSGGKSVYEGYIVQLNINKTQYKYYSLRFKIRDMDVNPYKLTVYGYSSNDAINTSLSKEYLLTHEIQPGVDRGFNDVVITNIVKGSNSQYVKVRIVPQTAMSSKTALPSEADIGVSTG